MAFRRCGIIVGLSVVTTCFLGISTLSHGGPSRVTVSHVVLADSAVQHPVADIQNRDDKDKKDKSDDKKKEPRYIDKKLKDDDRKDDKGDKKKEDRKPNDR